MRALRCGVRVREAVCSCLTALTLRPCSVRISALALVKMTMHCRSGGNLEVCAPPAGVLLARRGES